MFDNPLAFFCLGHDSLEISLRIKSNITPEDDNSFILKMLPSFLRTVQEFSGPC